MTTDQLGDQQSVSFTVAKDDFSSALAVSLTALAWGLPWHTGGSRVISRPFGNADTNRRERSDVRSGD